MIQTVKPEWIIADIKAFCPEVPTPLILRAIMRAVRQFSTTCMLETWIDLPTQGNVQHYPFERHLPKGYSVNYLSDVMYNNCCIPCLDDDCNSHCSSGYHLDDLNQISLVGYCPSEDRNDPECRDTLKIKVVLQPNNDACEIPKDMVNRFDEELMDGALGIILSMKNQSWTDNRAAEFHENRFQAGIASAKCLVGNKMNPSDTRILGERVI